MISMLNAIVEVSPDITINLGGVTVADEDVVADSQLGLVIPENLGSIPPALDLAAGEAGEASFRVAPNSCRRVWASSPRAGMGELEPSEIPKSVCSGGPEGGRTVMKKCFRVSGSRPDWEARGCASRRAP